MDFLQATKNIRTTILKMICKSKSSHIGSAFSLVELMGYIYINCIKEGDKLLFSKGHAGSVLYATLAEVGKIDKEELVNNYCQNGQKLGGHVTLGTIDGVDATAGSLGHGLALGIGMALSLKNNTIFVILGDGELNEGSIWEGFLFSPQKKLNNLIVVIDRNRQQGLGKTKDIVDIPDLSITLSSLGWGVQTIDGHDFEQIKRAFTNLLQGKPNVIIADTIKGKGVDFMEDNIDFHYKTPNEEQYQIALQQINS